MKREKTIQLTSPTAVIQKPLRNTAAQFNSLFQEINTVQGQAGIEAQYSMKDLFHGLYVDEGTFENEALENKDRSTKHPRSKTKLPKLENEAPKNSKTKTPRSKTKHPKLETGLSFI